MSQSVLSELMNVFMSSSAILSHLECNQLSVLGLPVYPGPPLHHHHSTYDDMADR